MHDTVALLKFIVQIEEIIKIQTRVLHIFNTQIQDHLRIIKLNVWLMGQIELTLLTDWPTNKNVIGCFFFFLLSIKHKI